VAATSSRRLAWRRLLRAGALVALLGVPSAHAQTSRRLDVHSKGEFSVYTDSDAVTVFTPAASATAADPLSGVSVSGGYLVDVVSAASVDIVSAASPNWHEVRQAANLSGEYKPGDLGLRAKTALSSEPDYLSLSGGVTGLLDLNDKNLSLSAGYAYGHDTAGRTGTPFSVYSLVLQRHALDASLAMLLNRSTVFTVTADCLLESGRQEKPYRYLPLFDASIASRVAPGAGVDEVNRLRLPGRMAERVPDTRQRFALSGKLAHRGSASTLLLDQRLYGDSWALLASTADLRWVFDASRRWFIWPHLRTHLQSGVSFWRRTYVGEIADGSLTVPSYRTGNRELSPLWSQTAGAGARYDLGGSDPEAWGLTFELEGTYTAYRNALYIRERWAAFGTLELDMRFR
jgi:hypothetical protein